MGDLGPLSSYGASPAPAPTGDLGPAEDYLVNQTVFPKGQAPVQITQSKAAEFALHDKIDRWQNALAQAQRTNQYGETPLRGETNFGISGAKEIGDALLGLPSVALNTMNKIPQAASNAIGAVTGYTPLPDLSVPQVGVDKTAAAIRAATGPQTYDQALENIDLQEGAREKVHPNSTYWGKVAGDIATVVGLRSPLAENIVGATKSPDELLRISRMSGFGPGGPMRQLKVVWNSGLGQTLRRGIGKIGETGLEGYGLALLHGGDPMATGTATAGAQAAGSLAMFFGRRFPITSASLGTLAGSIVGYQMWKDAIPGGRNSLMQSAETVIKAMTLNTIVGVAGGLFGAGRFRGSGPAWKGDPSARPPVLGHGYAENLPETSDAINATLRTGPSSIIRQFMGDDKSKSPVIAPVMEKLSTNLQAFQPLELQRISRAITAGKLRPTLQEMLKDQDFAERMSQ